MGLDSRDYARDGFQSDGGGWNSGGGGLSGNFGDWPFWQKIIAINVLVFLLQVFLTRPTTMEDLDRAGLTQDLVEQAELTPQEREQIMEHELAFMPRMSIVQDWCALDTAKVLQGQVWRVVTCGFLHDRHSIWHLLFNMLFLYWFGGRLERRYGAREFGCFYFAALLASSLAYIGLDFYTGSMVPAVGASGAVWGVVALYAILYPYERLYVYLLFPVQIRFLALVYFLFDLHPVLLALSGEETYGRIAHAAHVGGALFGFSYWYFEFRITPWLDKLTGRKSRWTNYGPRQRNESVATAGNDPIRILPFPGAAKPRLDEADEAKMDAILQKISDLGRESLTEDENAFLIRTSEQLRNK